MYQAQKIVPISGSEMQLKTAEKELKNLSDLEKQEILQLTLGKNTTSGFRGYLKNTLNIGRKVFKSALVFTGIVTLGGAAFYFAKNLFSKESSNKIRENNAVFKGNVASDLRQNNAVEISGKRSSNDNYLANVTEEVTKILSSADKSVDQLLQELGFSGQSIGDIDNNKNSHETGAPAATILNSAPNLITNMLVIEQGKELTLTTSNLNANDLEHAASDLIFLVSNVQHGIFYRVNGTKIAVTDFTMQEIIDGNIRFKHDNGINAPSYSISVSDKASATYPVPAAIIFTLHTPKLESIDFDIRRGKQTTITSAMLRASDTFDDATRLEFVISSLQGGFFIDLDNPKVAIVRFTQNRINNGKIAFVSTSEELPQFTVTVTDGFSISNTAAAIIRDTAKVKSSIFTVENTGAIVGISGGIVGTLAPIVGYFVKKFSKKKRGEVKPDEVATLEDKNSSKTVDSFPQSQKKTQIHVSKKTDNSVSNITSRSDRFMVASGKIVATAVGFIKKVFRKKKKSRYKGHDNMSGVSMTAEGKVLFKLDSESSKAVCAQLDNKQAKIDGATNNGGVCLVENNSAIENQNSSMKIKTGTKMQDVSVLNNPLAENMMKAISSPLKDLSENKGKDVHRMSNDNKQKYFSDNSNMSAIDKAREVHDRCDDKVNISKDVNNYSPKFTKRSSVDSVVVVANKASTVDVQDKGSHVRHVSAQEKNPNVFSSPQKNTGRVSSDNKQGYFARGLKTDMNDIPEETTYQDKNKVGIVRGFNKLAPPSFVSGKRNSVESEKNVKNISTDNNQNCSDGHVRHGSVQEMAARFNNRQ